MAFACCASDLIFWFAALEILALILLPSYNLFLTKSRFNIPNSGSHRGLTFVLLLQPCTKEVQWKEQGNSSVDQPPHFLTNSRHAPPTHCGIMRYVELQPGNKPKGLCMLLWARKVLPSYKILKGAEDFLHPATLSMQDLCPPGQTSLWNWLPHLKSEAAEWQSQRRNCE